MYDEIYKPCNPDDPSNVDLFTVKEVPLITEMFEKLNEMKQENIDNSNEDCNNT